MIEVALQGDLSAVLQTIPTTAGVSSFLGPDGKVLLVGRSASLRKWAEKNLGRGKPAKKGGRPPLDLTPVARALRYEPTTSDFHQRLVYERWMAPLVPIAQRRDLKPPVFLRLDPSERFPRVVVQVGAPAEPRSLFGPFRDRKSAERTLGGLHKAHPLRPCDFAFEPDPALPLGLGCLYAQVRSCAAPCLGRVSEDGYRALAARAVAELGGARDVAWRPAWVGAAGGRGIVVANAARGVELYPVLAGAVLEESRVLAESFAAGLPDVRFPPPAPPRDDWPWLVSWLTAPKRKGVYFVLRDDPA